jgi:hypothetical protein
MPTHTAVKQISGEEWAVVGRVDDRVIATYPTEHAANRAIADDKTPAERAAAFGDATYSAEKMTYSREDEVMRRFEAGLPLPVSDTKLAKRLLRARSSRPVS